jgi:hypothetical protein
LGDYCGLAGPVSENSGEDVEDAGVEIGFYYCGEDLGGVDEGGKSGFEEGDGFFVEFIARCIIC